MINCRLVVLVLLLIPFALQAQYTISYSGSYDQEYGPNSVDPQLNENEVSDPIPIGFPFYFYGQPYDSLRMSDNGFITFGNSTNDGCCDGQYLPDTSQPNNLIALAWMDLSANYGYFQYELFGVAPHRRLVITYSASDNCDYYYLDGQIKLFEGSYDIEFHTDLSSYYYYGGGGSAPYYSCYYVTQGIENADGTQALSTPGRNSGDWDAYGDYVKYECTGCGPDDDMAMVYTPTLYCAGNQTLNITATNAGGNTVDSFMVGWTWDGVAQPDVNANQFSLSPSVSIGVDLGTKNLVFGNSYELKTWTFNPNGVVDPNTINDTITRTIHVGYEGVYTIGGVSPDFVSLQSAINAIDSVGVCDSVYLNVRPGTYIGNTTIDYITGTYNFPIIIQSETQNKEDVLFEFTSTTSSDNYIIEFDNVRNIHFKHISFDNLGTVYARNIYSRNAVSDISFTSCQFENDVFNNSNARLVEIGGSRDNFKFENNVFQGGLNGIYASSPTSFRHNEFYIVNNTFENQGQSAIYLWRIDEIEILDNKISNSISSFSNAIHLNDVEQGLLVSNNKISWVTSSGDGIYLVNSNNSGDTAIVSNNEIIMQATSSAMGMSLSGNSLIDAYFNSIYIQGAESTNVYGLNLSSGSVDFKNNNIHVTPYGYAINRFNGTINSDYNNLFSGGPYLIRNYTTDFVTLSEWQNAFNLDSHSVSVDPYYLSDTILVPQRSQLNMAGVDIAGINSDINQMVRSSPPDIGAYEFVPVAQDVALIALPLDELIPDGNYDVKILIENNGNNAVTSADIDWIVNGGAQTQVNWTGTLASGQVDTVTLGSVLLDVGMTYAMESFITNSNGSPELVTFNDSLVLDTIQPALSGQYTIGGTSPDFVDVLEAITAMEGGILDTTTFIIRSGQYSGAHVIPEVKGKSCTKVVYFKSETGNATDVVIDNNNINEYPFVMLNADGYIFQDLTFQSVITNKGRVVTVDQGSDCNIFDRCHFIGINSSSTSANNALIYSPSVKDDGNAFVNSTFTEGSYGLYFLGGSFTNRESATRISNNYFENNYYRGIYVNNQNGIQMNGNVFVNAAGSSTSYSAAYATNCYDSTSFVDNIIDLDGSVTHTYAVYFSNLNAVGGASGLIANNYIKSSQARYGLTCNNMYNHRIEHNTVVLDRVTGSASAALYLSGGSHSNEIYSNILNNYIGSGPALFIQLATNVDSVNYNCLLDDGNFGLVQYNGVTYSDLNNWQSTGLGLNSISEDPQFVANSYLPASAFVESGGRPNPVATEDILDQPRNALLPDIGCVEFSTNTDDIAITEFKYPREPFSTGANPIVVRMFNNGADTLTSAEIYIEVNDSLLPTYYFSGLLAASEGYDSLDVAFFDFQAYTPYTIKVWGANPNGNTDGNAANDTIYYGPIYPALQGNYTIGGLDPDFNTINDAIAALDSGGASGAVNFLIRPGVYSETINLGDFPGASCSTSIVFESENQDASSVTINNLGINNNVLTMTDVDGITFKQITLEALNPSYGHCVDMYGHADCNTFDQCILRGIESASSSGNNSVIVMNSGPADQNSFIDNDIRYGSYGFFIQGNNTETETRILNNNLLDQYTRAIYIYRKKSAKIIGNYIESLTSFQSSYYGIYAQECNDSFVIEQNTIKAGSYCGVYVNGGARTAPARARIVNNMVSVGGSGTTWAMYLSGVRETDIFYNTLHNYSTYANATNNDAFFSTSTLAGNNIKNNIFVNTSGAGEAIDINGVLDSCDYNDIYSTSATIGRWSGSTTNTLVDWQNASGLDANSFSLDPLFVADNDLHVRQSSLNGSATSIISVTQDVDGELRDLLAPDIGADEFIPSANNNASIISLQSQFAPFAAGMQSIKVELKNDGGNALTSANIRWLINGVEQPVLNWTGSLASGADSIVTLGQYDILPLTSYNIMAWSELPNGVIDTINVNDTIIVEQIYAGLIGSYTLGGVLPDFANFNKLQSNICFGGLLGDIQVSVRDGIYTDNIVFNNIPRLVGNEVIEIEGESGMADAVVWQPSLSYGENVVKIDKESNIYFSNIKFESIYGHLASIEGGAANISFVDCILQGRLDAYGGYSLIHSPSTSDDSLTVHGCHLIGGYYGVLLNASSGDREQGLVIDSNIIEQFYSSGIYMSNQSNFELTRNMLLATNGYPSYGILSLSTTGTGSISDNEIKGSLLNNGIYLKDASHTNSEKLLVSNNFIHLPGAIAYQGIYLDRNVDYAQFFHNTISLSNEENTGRNFYLASYGSNNLEIENNILFNAGEGYFVDFNYNNAHASFDYNNYFGDNSSYVWTYTTDTALVNFQTTSSTNANSTNLNPLFVELDHYEIQQVGLNNIANPITEVATDISGQTRNVSTPDVGVKEFTPTPNDIGVTAFINPTTYCGLSATEAVTVRIQNFGSAVQSNFNVSYSMNGQPWKTENVGAIGLLGGQYIDYTFGTTEDMSVLGSYEFEAFCALAGDSKITNDTFSNHIAMHLPVLTDTPSMLVPFHQEMGVDLPLSLSWNPVNGADRYDVYIWKTGESKPATPYFENVNQINVIYSLAEYGQSYQWEVVAKNLCNQTTNSSVHNFTVRELPDLQVDSIVYPAMVNSGQSVEMEWIVTNSGTGATGATFWSDAIYLSADATLNLYYDDFLGAVPNLNALMSNESYQQTAEFNIPEGLVGEYYIFAYTDRYTDVIEANDGNNTYRTIGKIQITLTPPPDLVIEQIVVPATVFAGNTFPMQYTIKNNGTGDVDLTTWRDEWKLSNSPNNAGSGAWSKLDNNMMLAVDSTYTIMTNMAVSPSQAGPHFVHLEVDKTDNIFEFSGEHNNYAVSDTIMVLPIPPPDLLVDTVYISDTVSPNEIIAYQWIISNAGGSPTLPNNWTNRLHISPAPVFNSNFNRFVDDIYQYSPFLPTEKDTIIASGKIPIISDGQHYFYTELDRTNSVTELAGESNNIDQIKPVWVSHPDLTGDEVVTGDSVLSGQALALSWKFINSGPGNLFNRYVEHDYFISTDGTWNPVNAISIKNQNNAYSLIHGDTLAPDTLQINTLSNVPDGLQGDYYLYILINDQHAVEEHQANYANNIIRSVSSFTIQLDDYPDFVPTQVVVPDTGISGVTIPITYEIQNQGLGDANRRGTERLYISFNPIWNENDATLVYTSVSENALLTNESVTVNRVVTIPASLPSNVYYIYTQVDAENELYEYQGEENNILRSAPIFIKPYPAVDLSVTALNMVAMLDTLRSPATYSLQYLVTNNSLSAPLLADETDGFYLTTDSVFAISNAIDVGSFYQNKTNLMPDSSNILNGMALLPNGLEGNYYLWVEIDKTDENQDPDRSNNMTLVRHSNGQAKQFVVVRKPSPDFVFTNLSWPSSVIAGRNYEVSYTIKNIGEGVSTTSNNRIFISTDDQINGGDIQICNENQSFLWPDSSHSNTCSFTIPSQLQGNYYLIAQTDYLDKNYEWMGEENNEVLRIFEVIKPPPADLIVEDIVVPLTVLAGSQATVSWGLTNQGDNPALGNVRDIVYLSADSILDVADQVFGYADSFAYFAPSSTQERTLTAAVNGVVDANYYAIVRTDALDQVIETNDTNNISNSIDLMSIDIKTLPIDSLIIDSLFDDQELYYKIVIGPELEGETILVEIKGDSLNAANELYVRYNQIATRAEFDWSSLTPGQHDQKIIISDVQIGTYYVTSFGSSLSSSVQALDLYARVMGREILDISPERGAQGEFVTMLIHGSKLTGALNVRLRNQDTTATVHSADTFVVISDEYIFARFNLDSVALGQYFVDCLYELSEPIAVYEPGFQVFSGQAANIVANWELTPGSATQFNRPIKLRVNIINNGDGDAVGQTMLLYSPAGNVLATSLEDLYNGVHFDELIIPIGDHPNFGNLLSPGESRQIEYYSYNRPYPIFVIQMP